ncbi:MAG: WD40 domain-containing protein [archaeon]|nr:WD40 domain-containing protein [archaeon]
MIIGTQTSGQEANYLMVAKVKFPFNQGEEEELANKEKDLITNFQKEEKKIEVEIKIKHEGDINKARPMPSDNNYNIIATQTEKGEIHIYDYFKHPNQPKEENEEPKPELKLKSHTEAGFGLNWNIIKKGQLVSGNNDGKVCLWQINEQKGGIEGECPVVEWNQHEACNDVIFNKINPNIIFSCGEDKKIIHYDSRDKSSILFAECDSPVNAIDFNCICETMLLAGLNNNKIIFYDTRMPNISLHEFKGHTDKVLGVKWNYRIPNLFASFSSDGTIIVWDISKVKEKEGGIISENNSLLKEKKEKESEKKENIPNELIFIHGGHTLDVNDFDWNNNIDLMMVSVAQDNTLNIWEMKESFYFNE